MRRCGHAAGALTRDEKRTELREGAAFKDRGKSPTRPLYGLDSFECITEEDLARTDYNAPRELRGARRRISYHGIDHIRSSASFTTSAPSIASSCRFPERRPGACQRSSLLSYEWI